MPHRLSFILLELSKILISIIIFISHNIDSQTLKSVNKNVQQRIRFTLQLRKFHTENYRLIPDDCSCARQIGNQKTIWPFCNYQFTTSVNFGRNLQPAVISTHLINPLDHWIYFDRTKQVDGCNQNISQHILKFKFTCNDSTWQYPVTYFLEDIPMSISIVTFHYGDAVCSGVALDHWIPPTNWLVDTFHLFLKDSIPYAYNATGAIGRSYNLLGLANRGNSLQLSVETQCLNGWWGPACNFSTCSYARPNMWKCKHQQQDDDFYWLCSNDQLTSQAWNCSYCNYSEHYVITDGLCVKENETPQQIEANQTWCTIGLIFFALLAFIELILIFALVYKMKKKKYSKRPSAYYIDCINSYNSKDGPWWTVTSAVSRGGGSMRQRETSSSKDSAAGVVDPEWPLNSHRRIRHLSSDSGGPNLEQIPRTRREAIV